MKKRFESFEEIEKELALIRLKREIAAQSLRYSIHKTRERFSMPNLVSESTNWIKDLLLSMIAKKTLTSILKIANNKPKTNKTK